MAGTSLTISINGDAKKFETALRRAAKQTESLEKQLTSAAKVSTIAFVGLTAAITGTVIAAAKMESIHTQFEVLTGNTEDATRAMKELQEFSATTPFQFEQIASAGQTLLTFGTSLDNLTPMLQQLGDVAAAANKSIDGLADVFVKVRAEGKLNLEVYNQLAQTFKVNIGPAIAREMGVGETAVRKLITAGKVSTETFEKVFKSLSQEGGPAFNAMIKQSTTMAGLWSTLKDNLALVAAEMGEKFLPIFKRAAILIIEFFQFIRDNPVIVQMAANFLLFATAVTGVIAVATTAGVVFLKLRAAMIAAQIATTAMKIATIGLMGATGIGLLVVVITDLALNWERRVEQMRAIWHAFTNNVGDLASGLGMIISGAILGNLTLITGGAQKLKETALTSFDEINAELDEKAAERRAKEEADAAANHQTLKTNLMVQAKELSDIEKQFKKDQEKADKDARLKFLKDQQKFGAAFAQINAMMNSEIFQGNKKAFGELAVLQSSSNSTLKGIGKVSAIATVIIKTAESAMNIFAGFSTIPIIGPALGIAGAAAAVAFGGEQIGKINSAQTGGLVTGGIMGRDSVPTMLAPGEIVIPSRLASSFDNLSQGGGVVGDDFFNEKQNNVNLMIGFEGNEAANIITIRQNEDRALGTSQEIV